MKYKKRRRLVVCRCDAYKFPHRQGGGACEGPPPDVPNCLVSYIHSRQAWIDAGVSEKDFG